jgi:hypothetical protein
LLFSSAVAVADDVMERDLRREAVDAEERTKEEVESGRERCMASCVARPNIHQWDRSGGRLLGGEEVSERDLMIQSQKHLGEGASSSGDALDRSGSPPKQEMLDHPTRAHHRF